MAATHWCSRVPLLHRRKLGFVLGTPLLSFSSARILSRRWSGRPKSVQKDGTDETRRTWRPALRFVIDGWLTRPSLGDSGSYHRIHFAYFNGAAVLESRTIPAYLNSGVIVWSLDQVKAAEPLFGLAVRTIGSHGFAILVFQHPARLIRELVTGDIDVFAAELLPVGHVFLHPLLLLLGIKLEKGFRIVVEQEHVLRHVSPPWSSLTVKASALTCYCGRQR